MAPKRSYGTAIDVHDGLSVAGYRPTEQLREWTTLSRAPFGTLRLGDEHIGFGIQQRRATSYHLRPNFPASRLNFQLTSAVAALKHYSHQTELHISDLIEQSTYCLHYAANERHCDGREDHSRGSTQRLP